MRNLPTTIGSFVGFCLFIVFGAVPGLLYGGYMGLVLSKVLLGATSGLIASGVIWGGMVLGLLATLFFFLVFGALAGTIVGAVVGKFVTPTKRPETYLGQ